MGNTQRLRMKPRKAERMARERDLMQRDVPNPAARDGPETSRTAESDAKEDDEEETVATQASRALEYTYQSGLEMLSEISTFGKEAETTAQDGPATSDHNSVQK